MSIKNQSEQCDVLRLFIVSSFALELTVLMALLKQSLPKSNLVMRP